MHGGTLDRTHARTGEEDGGRGFEDGPDAHGKEGQPVAGPQVRQPHGADQDDHAHLDGRKDDVEHGAPLCAAAEHEGQRQQQERGDEAVRTCVFMLYHSARKVRPQEGESEQGQGLPLE